ncbi:MAG: tRNA (guanosine(46)-N7)-methyltransferase TrmB [Planctomycetaceae bacterium]|nr:tRNA (guanosine(46)-N7)-methyltransferase TrmB [Planctomycetaceae bacterium]
MGRRALPKIDETIDLSRHFYKVETLPAPWDPAAIYGRDAPLEIELGSGKGLFLQNAALGTPERNFLGVEIAYKYAKFIGHRLAKRHIGNAVAVHGDGLKMFREQVPDASLAAIHVYFPDPWWKARHHKRRVMNESFLADVVRTLEPGGRLHFWTDVKEYFDAALALISEVTPLVGPLVVSEKSAEHDLDFRTHFERRTRLHGEPVYRSEFVKL